MEVELISRETIKPSSPTPSHLKIYPLSLIDHIVARNYVPTIFFYPNPDTITDVASKVSALKKSVSEVLSIYYPFAGRFRDQLSIDCNDQGVPLLVTKMKCNLSSVVQHHSEALPSPLFADELHWKDMGYNSSIVAIQINCFECGGIAISVLLSHKVGDGSTLFHFVNDWAHLTTNSPHGSELTLPVFDVGSSVLPQGDTPILPEVRFTKQNTVCGRFVFEASKIEALKAVVSSHEVGNPSRVEVVIALIYKRATSVLGLATKTTPLRIAANLRKKMVPPLHEKSIGNLVWSFPVSMDKGEGELHEFVSKTREGLNEFCDKYVKNFGDMAFVSEFLKQATSLPKKKEATSSGDQVVASDQKKLPSLFFFASWCRFPTYEVDFGWGKPIWVTTIGCPVKNSVVLMDARDGNGIEALVNMEEHDMAKFGRDEELLQYASLNPNVGLANGF